MNRQHLIAGIATAALATTIGALIVADQAHGQVPGCGGNSKTHPAPIDCENTTTVDGIKGSVRLVVDDTGYVMVTAVIQDRTPDTAPPPLFLQVKAHVGISSPPGGYVGKTDVFDGNTASLELQMPSCEGQIDVKIVPGQPTLNHVAPIYRVAAPLVSHGCDTTTTTTVPTTVPVTTVPASSSPTTSTPSSTPTTSVSTTSPQPSSSVVGGTIPATGWTDEPLGYAILTLFVGAFIVLATIRRPAS